MNGLVKDLATYYAGLGHTSIYQGINTVLPTDDGPLISLVLTGGTSPDYVQNQVEAGYRHPAARICVHAKLSSVGREKIEELWTKATIRNTTIDGTRYVSIRPLQDPYELGPDRQNRSQFAFNVIAELATN